MVVTGVIASISSWLLELLYQFGYIGIFFISLFGNFTVIFPVPYVLFIFTSGTIEGLNPLIIGLVGGIGSTIGELSAYGIGWGGRKILEKRGSSREIARIEMVEKLIGKFGTPIAILVFALTPLPDDLLIIPLGMMQYPLIPFLTFMFLGKTALNLLVAYGGRYSASWILDLFGGEEVNTIIVILTIIAMVGVVILLLRVDWLKVLTKKREDTFPNEDSKNKKYLFKRRIMHKGSGSPTHRE